MDKTTAEPSSTCPSCGADLEVPYYQFAPSRPARVLRKTAMGLLPVMAVAFAVLLFSGKSRFGERAFSCCQSQPPIW